ncbi:hypothetical protein [Clostridium sp. OS1-26]|nr:hypothetical protein [Clostridium sp. OS1-26]WML33375.1 hypothetical protein RCG18_18750 [Clostridium sp. OS1-26]
MEAKIFMSVSQLVRSLLGVFVLGIIFGGLIGGFVVSKFKKRLR